MNAVAEYTMQARQELYDQFLKGDGDPTIFEVTYLTYLEVEQVAKGRNPQAVWKGWVELLSEGLGDGEQFVPLSRKVGSDADGRKELARQLDLFAKRFHFPRRTTFTAPAPKAETPIEDLFGDTT